MQTRSFLVISSLLTAMSIATTGSAGAAPSVEKSEPVVRSQDWDFHAEAKDLLGEIQSIAGQLAHDAGVLESYSRSRLSWESHAAQLTLVRERVNAIGKGLSRLQAIKEVAAPWQQQAIDSALPVAVNLAGRTEAAIKHLNENRNYLWAQVYVDHLETISDHADQMKECVDLHLELASTQDKLEQLRSKLATTRL